MITEDVYSEVAEEGLILEKEDTEIIKKHIGKRIQIKNPGSSSNEREGRNAAKIEGVKVKGSIGVLFDA